MAKSIILATAGDKVPYANGGLKLSKTILLDKINLHPDFQKLFDIEPELLDRITQSIKENGFDNSQPLHLWVHDGNYDLIDGYTRYAALKAAGKDTAPYFEHNFDTFDEAYKYVLSLQVNRRNLSGAELLRHVSILTGVTNNEFVEGKKSKAIAEALGVSTRTVEKALAVEKKADEETKEKINSGEMSVNQAYNKIKNKEKREKISQATEDDLMDLPFDDENACAEDSFSDFDNTADEDISQSSDDTDATVTEAETQEEDFSDAQETGNSSSDSLDAFDMFYDEEEVADAETSWTNSGSTVEFHDDAEVDYATDWHISWGTLCILKAALEYEQEHHDDGYGGARRKALKKVKELLDRIAKRRQAEES